MEGRYFPVGWKKVFLASDIKKQRKHNSNNSYFHADQSCNTCNTKQFTLIRIHLLKAQDIRLNKKITINQLLLNETNRGTFEKLS